MNDAEKKDEFEEAWNEEFEGTDDDTKEGDDDATLENDEEVVEETAEEETTEIVEETVPTDEDVKLVTQKLQSMQGRLKKATAETEAKEAEAEALTAKLESIPEKEDPEDTEKENRLAQLTEDYPEVNELIDYRLKTTQQYDSTEIESKVNKAVEVSEKALVEQHNSAINAVHSDFGEIVGTGVNDAGEATQSKLNNWIDGLPFKQGKEFSEICETGSTGQVIGMLNTYKESLDPKTDKRDKQIAASQGVKRSGTPLPKGKVDKNDFDGAWAETFPDD